MSDLKNKIIEEFGHKLRIRVCGLLVEDGKILMVNHHALNESDDFWGPPGGGMDFSASAEENLKREFKEEVGIHVEIEGFAFVHEYLSPPLHAVELFFLVRKIDGEVNIGFDPEMGKGEQIIKDAQFISFEDLKQMDITSVHQVFMNFDSLEEMLQGQGYFLYKK